MAEVVVFNGVRFRRYPDSPHRTDRCYFTPGIAERKAGIEHLHREIWKAEHGLIPAGHHIHHRDGNPLNNDIDNLACLSPKDHKAEHWTEERSRAQREHAEAIRPLTVEWHRSPEGRAWHRQHGREAWAKRQGLERQCDQCGQSFDSITRRDNDRFCSNKCKTAWRRASGVDDEERTCGWCGEAFTVNRYSRTKTCSRSCGGKLRRANG